MIPGEREVLNFRRSRAGLWYSVYIYPARDIGLETRAKRFKYSLEPINLFLCCVRT